MRKNPPEESHQRSCVARLEFKMRPPWPFPAVLSTVHAQSDLAAVWGHCPCSMRSGCGLGQCTTQMSYFEGFLCTVDRKCPQTRVSAIFFARRSGQSPEKGKTLRNGTVPGRAGAHDPARAAEGAELRSTSVEFSGLRWVSDPVRREGSGRREIGRRGWRPPDSGAA